MADEVCLNHHILSSNTNDIRVPRLVSWSLKPVAETNPTFSSKF